MYKHNLTFVLLGKRKEAAYKEAIECIYDIHEGKESGGHQRMYSQRVGSH